MIAIQNNEFETIPAFHHIAGDSLGTWSERDIVTAMIKFLSQCSQFDCAQYYIDIATTHDDDQYLIDLQDTIAQDITENCPLADYCTIELTDSEWKVSPYIDDELLKIDSIADKLIIIDTHTDDITIVKTAHYSYLYIDSFGNTLLMQWNATNLKYISVWSIDTGDNSA